MLGHVTEKGMAGPRLAETANHHSVIEAVTEIPTKSVWEPQEGWSRFYGAQRKDFRS